MLSYEERIEKDMKKKILSTLLFIIGGIAGIIAEKNMVKKTIKQKDEKIYKFKGYYSLLNQWLSIKQSGRGLEEYFIANGYKTIAIYGMGELGLRLYEELKNSKEVEIKYAVDQGAALCEELEILGLDDSLPEVDVIVVTATFVFEEIAKMLREKTEGEIISLDDIIDEL